MAEEIESAHELLCAGCGRVIRAGAAFCTDCGASSDQATTAPKYDWMEYGPRRSDLVASRPAVDRQRFALAGVLGLVAALILGYGWYTLTVNTEQEFSLVAILVGFLVGLVVTFVGEGSTANSYRLLGGALAAVSIIVGQYLIYARPESPGFIEFSYFQPLIIVIAFAEGWMAPRFAASRGLLAFGAIGRHNQGLFLAMSLFLLALVLAGGAFSGLLVGPDAIMARIHVDRAQGLIDDQRYSRAAAELQQAVEKYEQYPTAHFMLGFAHWELGEFAEAKESFSQALALGLDEDGDPLARLYLGFIEWQLNDERAAFKHLSDVIEGGADIAEAYLLRGFILSNRGQFEAAKADLDRAIFLGLGPEDQKWAEEALEHLPSGKVEG